MTATTSADYSDYWRTIQAAKKITESAIWLDWHEQVCVIPSRDLKIDFGSFTKSLRSQTLEIILFDVAENQTYCLSLHNRSKPFAAETAAWAQEIEEEKNVSPSEFTGPWVYDAGSDRWR